MEQKIWRTQFGFRSGRGTADAVLLARPLIESALAANLVLLALDWSKAFDSVDPDGLVVAFARFGIPDKYCDMIRALPPEPSRARPCHGFAALETKSDKPSTQNPRVQKRAPLPPEPSTVRPCQ